MIQRSEEIKDLCESYLILGMDILDGYHCDSIDCKFCPFSDDNNNGILCRRDSKEHYNEIAKKYLREYESDDDSICFEEEGEDTVETLHHVGDKVKIREDLEIDECYEGCDFVDDMEEFKGKIVTISKAYVDEYDGEDNYHIKEDDGKFYWTNDMFEVVNDDDYYIEDDKEEEETTDILDKTLNFIEDNHIDFIQGNIIYDVMKGDKEYLESAKKWLDMLIMRN